MRKRWAKIRKRVGKILRKIRIPGYKPLTVYDFAVFYGEALFKGNIFDRAATMTFYFLLALFPLLIFVFSIIPFIPIDGLQESMLLTIRGGLPSEEVYSFFESTLEDVLLNQHAGVLSFSFILGIYFSSNAVFSVLNGLNDSYYLQSKRKMISQKIWSIGLLFVFIILFVISFLVSAVSGYLFDWLSEKNILTGNIAYILLTLLKLIISFFFFIAGISILYNVANTEKTKWRMFSAGDVASAILILLFSEIFGWYITTFTSYDNVYGPMGAVLVFVLFVYYVYIILMLGFEMNTSLQRAFRKSQDANPSA